MKFEKETYDKISNLLLILINEKDYDEDYQI